MGDKSDLIRNDFSVEIDHESGNICITAYFGGWGRRQSTSVIFSLEEMPERYQTFFAKYLLCKDR
jgi:hypothetical protein